MTEQEIVNLIAQVYRDGYRRQKAQDQEILEAMETGVGRQQLAIEVPEVYRAFESSTLDEREQITELLAISAGVAHAVLAAMRLQS